MIGMISGRGLSVLDIGAGDGDVVFELARKGYQCTAMDISRVRLEKYRTLAEAMKVRQLLGNVEEHIPLNNQEVDIVLCGEIIEHVPNNDKALAEINRVLKTGGQYIVSVPYRETLKIATCPDCGKKFEQNGHLHTYDKTILGKMLQKHGFRVEKIHIGHTKFSREIWMRWHSSLSRRICSLVDLLTYHLFRASDTWIMMKGIKISESD
jgi:ubiquinone/menaquinone biosynthesis C-methylase UbiE